jgi:hypothetical protein
MAAPSMPLVRRMELLRRSYAIQEFGKGKPGFRTWLRRQEAEVHRLLERSAEMETDHLRRDFREWRRGWTPADRMMTGSGRRAEWCHIVFLQYALCARLVAQHFGWTGQLVRDTARAVQRGMDGGGHDWMPPAVPVTTRELFRTATEPESDEDTTELYHSWEETAAEKGEEVDLQSRRAQWRLWIDRVARPAWGRFMLFHLVARLHADPSATTWSDVVGEVRRLRGAQDVTDFRGCSGCQYLREVEKHPEFHDWFLSRAKKAQPVKLRHGLEGVAVPFGLEYPPEFDHVLVLAMDHEVRVRSADYDALTAEQKAALVHGGAL